MEHDKNTKPAAVLLAALNNLPADDSHKRRFQQFLAYKMNVLRTDIIIEYLLYDIIQIINIYLVQ